MRHRFFETAFTGAVLTEQERHGSRATYAKLAGPGPAGGAQEALGDDEIGFISARDSLYLGTVSETGWPHVQHRGGPPGFVKVLNDRTLGWADFSGNRQYVSIGNVVANDRVALFFMDYPRRTRLKVLGHMRTIEAGEGPELAEALNVPGYSARVEHLILINVEAFDWNCPQHIVERFTAAEVELLVAPLQRQIEDLQARLARADAAR